MSSRVQCHFRKRFLNFIYSYIALSFVFVYKDEWIRLIKLLVILLLNEDIVIVKYKWNLDDIKSVIFSCPEDWWLLIIIKHFDVRSMFKEEARDCNIILSSCLDQWCLFFCVFQVHLRRVTKSQQQHNKKER